jgi:hypothetical protein
MTRWRVRSKSSPADNPAESLSQFVTYYIEASGTYLTRLVQARQGVGNLKMRYYSCIQAYILVCIPLCCTERPLQLADAKAYLK